MMSLTYRSSQAVIIYGLPPEDPDVCFVRRVVAVVVVIRPFFYVERTYHPSILTLLVVQDSQLLLLLLCCVHARDIVAPLKNPAGPPAWRESMCSIYVNLVNSLVQEHRKTTICCLLLVLHFLLFFFPSDWNLFPERLDFNILYQK